MIGCNNIFSCKIVFYYVIDNGVVYVICVYKCDFFVWYMFVIIF